jgi:hypothetical protein
MYASGRTAPGAAERTRSSYRWHAIMAQPTCRSCWSLVLSSRRGGASTPAPSCRLCPPALLSARHPRVSASVRDCPGRFVASSAVAGRSRTLSKGTTRMGTADLPLAATQHCAAAVTALLCASAASVDSSTAAASLTCRTVKSKATCIGSVRSTRPVRRHSHLVVALPLTPARAAAHIR